MTQGKKGRILVIDDEKGLRDMLSYSLGGRGWTVTAVEGGPQALEAARAQGFEIAVCDIMMPGMDGIEVLKALKELHADLEVVMVTGYATLETAVKAMKLGAFDYIAKPYELDELCTILDRADEHRNLLLRVAELEEMDRLRAHMLVALGHELRVPLGAVLAEAGRGKKEGGADLKRILENAGRMLDTVEGILYYSKLDAGLMPPYIEEFDLGELLREVTESLRPRALEKPVELTWKAPSPLKLRSDRVLVKQILVHLVGSALDVTKDGSVKLSAEARGAHQGVDIRLHDSGLKFEPAELPRLFAPRKGAGGKGHDGRGLGLPVTRRLVEFLGGTIKVESGPERGSVFTVALPEAAARA